MPLRRSHGFLLAAVALICLGLFYLGQPISSSRVDWSRFAYSQYATDSTALCNAVMVFEALHRLGSKADRILLYPRGWDTTVDSKTDRDSQLLNLARDYYKVKLEPVELLATKGKAEAGTFDHPQSGWDTSITKLLAFDLTQYSRVLHLDSDINLLQHLDELFLLPPTPVAMARAYWSDVQPGQAIPLTSLLMLIEPNPRELKYMMEFLHSGQADKGTQYDMDLLNERFASSAAVLPHRPYALLSAEFRSHDHTKYLGASPALQTWDAEAVLKEAKLVHFSDWPLPKPWIMWPIEGLVEMQPDCGGGEANKAGCVERRIWKELYEDNRRRRKDICKVLSVPAPEWAKWKHQVKANG